MGHLDHSTRTARPPENAFVGRQPIFGHELKVYAYELFYRSAADQERANIESSDDMATSQTIINTFINIGLDRLVGNKMAAINITEAFLLEENRIPFTPRQVIIEILESIPVTGPMINAVARLAKEGYTIALDDYIYNPAHAPLIQLASIVKIDLTLVDRDELARHVEELRQYKVKLLAEKVETPDDYLTCVKLGFDYFQGYFLSRPQTISAERLPANRMTIMNLLAVVNNPEADNEDLAEAINTDVNTSYKLLRMINSAAFNLPRKVESIQHCIILLGRRKLASWASMLALCSLDDRPLEILHIAMIRAKMCEILAETTGSRQPESYFTVGMFSALDLIMQRPLEKLLQPLPLSSEIVAALIHREGRMGQALNCVMAYEIADWSQVSFSSLSPDEITEANLDAITWANIILDIM